MAKVAVWTRQWLGDWRRYLQGIPMQLWGNPVVSRELRVRVRLGRSYLLQSVYLGFLILITMLAYTNLVFEEVWRNPFSAQQYLQGFHTIVMVTLATLIVLIAPGLTANAITLERERRTIDLILTTPLTARQLLTGKLFGSLAFTILLLALTLPISGVSVLLGGATFRELLETYVLMASSAMGISAIALFSSVYARSSTMAVLWSYTRVGFFVLILSWATLLQSTMRTSTRPPGATGQELILPISALSPFSAPFVADTFLKVGGVEIPGVVVGVVFCLLMTRLLLTGAAIKTGLYDKDSLPSLRRQIIFVMWLFAWLNSAPLLQILVPAIPANDAPWLMLFLIGITAVPMLFLTLFVTPYGSHDGRPHPSDGVFQLRKMFSTSPSGALPYLLTVWAAGVTGLVMGGIPFLHLLTKEHWAGILAMLLHYSGCIVFLWALARLCSELMHGRSLVGARMLTFACYSTVLLAPFILALLFAPSEPSTYSPFLFASIFYPLFVSPDPDPTEMYIAFFSYGVVLWMLGLFISFLVERHTNRRCDVS